MAECKNCGQCDSATKKMKDFKRVVALQGTLTWVRVPYLIN